MANSGGTAGGIVRLRPVVETQAKSMLQSPASYGKIMSRIQGCARCTTSEGCSPLRQAWYLEYHTYGIAAIHVCDYTAIRV